MENTTENKFLRLSGISEINTESGADYTLPDYLGDVRKILFTECALRQAGHFSDDSGDEFSGIVVYDIVYLDAENKPTRASFTSDFELKLKGEENRERTICTPVISTYSIRLNGPRRISARANISASLRCIVYDEIVQTGTAFEEGERRLQSKEACLNLRCAVASVKVEREFAEKLSWVEGAIADEVEVIYSTATAEVEKACAGEGEVKLSGELKLSALISSAGAPLYLAEKSVPFEVNVPMEGELEEMKFIPIAEVVSVTSSVNAEEAGAEVAVCAIVEFSAVGEFNSKRKISEDVFLAYGHAENTYRDYRYTELYDCVSTSVSNSTEIGLDKLTQEKIRDIPYLSAVAKVENSSLTDGDVKLSGELRVVGVASVIDDDGGVSYTGLKFSIPFDVDTKCSVTGSDGVRVEHSVEVNSISALVDTDSAKISYMLGVCAVCSGSVLKKVVQSSDVAEGAVESEEKSITVYYPTDGDTLFGVAKKFRVPVYKIAAANDISSATSTDGDASLDGICRLFIY